MNGAVVGSWAASEAATLWPAGGRAAVPRHGLRAGRPGRGTPGAAGARRAEGRRLGPGGCAREGGDRAALGAGDPAEPGARAAPLEPLPGPDAGGSLAGPGWGCAAGRSGPRPRSRIAWRVGAARPCSPRCASVLARWGRTLRSWSEPDPGDLSLCPAGDPFPLPRGLTPSRGFAGLAACQPGKCG